MIIENNYKCLQHQMLSNNKYAEIIKIDILFLSIYILCERAFSDTNIKWRLILHIDFKRKGIKDQCVMLTD